MGDATMTGLAGLAMDPIARPVVPENDKVQGTLHPTGYRILVQLLPPEETMERLRDSKLQMPDEVREREWQAQMQAVVIEMGPDCYQDEKRFPDKRAWCKPGDVVMIRPYSGTRFAVRGNLYALINDDTVQAVLAEPGAIERP